MVTVRRTTAAVLIGVLVMAGVACGSDDAESGSPELLQNVADQFKVLLPLDDEQATCFAAQMVDIYGPDEMQQFVDDPENYSPAEEASPEVTQKALEDCGIDAMELVQDRNVQGDTGDINTGDVNTGDVETGVNPGN